jgi:hypothetical protein
MLPWSNQCSQRASLTLDVARDNLIGHDSQPGSRTIAALDTPQRKTAV